MTTSADRFQARHHEPKPPPVPFLQTSRLACSPNGTSPAALSRSAGALASTKTVTVRRLPDGSVPVLVITTDALLSTSRWLKPDAVGSGGSSRTRCALDTTVQL